MDPSDAIQLLVLFILLCLSAFFSSAETALTTVNRIRIRSLVSEGNKRAAILTNIIEDSGKMLSAILIGNNIVNLSASALATSVAIKIWGNTAVGFVTGILTLLILVFGEITPKTLATIHAEKISLRYAKIIYLFMKVLTPFIFIINKLSIGFLILMRVDPNEKTNTLTEHELRTIVDVSHETGVIESEERQMIYNVFDFGDSQAKDIMIPRIDMTFASVDSSYDELLQIFREEKYTRFPIYQDTTDNVIGIINIKDLLLYDDPSTFCIQDIIREPHYTYEYKKTSELMIEMRQNLHNLAVVLDEYGATAGLITMEDLLEEIVGEIRDEYDDDEEDLIQLVSENEYIAEGSVKLSDVNDILNLSLASNDYDSLAGFMIEQLDHLPESGESFTTDDGTHLVVGHVDKNRVDKIKIYLTPKQKEES